MASLISIMSNLVKEKGGINLAQGIPGFEPPQLLLETLSKLVQSDIHQYAPALGNLNLRKLILEKYSAFANFQPENLLITNGATEAISLIYTYLNRKLKHLSVLAFEPVYETYFHLPKIFDDSYYAFSYGTDLELDFEELEKVIIEKKTNLIFLNTPGNPLGKVWKKSELEKILQLIEKYQVYLIIDAVYREIYFRQEPYIPFEFFSEKIFYVNSFSKLFSITGWRIGYFFMHESHAENMRNLHDYIGLCASSVMQEALAGFIKSSNFGMNYVQKLREKISASYTLLSEALPALGFEVKPAAGGYFIWTQLPDNYKDGYETALDFYESEKIAVVPGEHFSENGKNFIRINIARNISEIYKSIESFKRYFGVENSQKALFFKRMTSIRSCHC